MASRRKIMVFLQVAMMLLGWGTLAVPTGIVTSEMTAQRRNQPASQPHAPATNA